MDGYESTKWPVDWSAIWVGALTALSVALLFGLVGISLGAYNMGPPITRWSDFSVWALVFSVFGSFLAFVLGGWVTCRIGGFRRADTATLHGGILWVLATPILLLLAGLGAGMYFGSWYGGLAGTPAWVTPRIADANAAILARHGALGSLTALLLGLIGAVVGGWMGSGEPMRLTHRTVVSERTSEEAARIKVRRV